jgi:hypothetical protein
MPIDFGVEVARRFHPARRDVGEGVFAYLLRNVEALKLSRGESAERFPSETARLPTTVSSFSAHCRPVRPRPCFRAGPVRCGGSWACRRGPSSQPRNVERLGRPQRRPGSTSSSSGMCWFALAGPSRTIERSNSTTLSMAAAGSPQLARPLQAKLPKYPLPVALIGRFAIDQRATRRRRSTPSRRRRWCTARQARHALRIPGRALRPCGSRSR